MPAPGVVGENMGIYTNFVCENSKEKGCNLMPLNFDHEKETWEEMLAFAKSQGWTFEGAPKQSSMKCWCESCSKK